MKDISFAVFPIPDHAFFEQSQFEGLLGDNITLYLGRQHHLDFRGASTNQFGGIASHNGLGINVLHHDRSCPDYGRMSDFDARPDKGSCTNPALTCDPYWSTDESERNVPVIMRARAKVRFLRYNGMRSNRYFGHRIESRIIANPDVVTDRQIPRVRYPYTRSDENVLSDLRAK
jgi:hypothetical protein